MIDWTSWMDYGFYEDGIGRNTDHYTTVWADGNHDCQ